MSNQDISTKGLDDFSRKYLVPSNMPTEEEYVSVSGGQKASKEALDAYFEKRMQDFIKRAGGFTEDLVAFIIEQKLKRGLSDRETVFGIALTNINLRHAYGSPQADSEKITPERRKELLTEFDEVCWGAQIFWEANK
jgi:hypothetical protein